MYQPLGLEGGHKFCADCGFSTVKKRKATGIVRCILERIMPSVDHIFMRAGGHVSVVGPGVRAQSLRRMRLSEMGMPSGTARAILDCFMPSEPITHMQEAMYQPLGLECGHKFCADCAFSAVGKGNALGTVRAILDHVDPDAACPECRTKGVFVFAMELKATEKLIKQRRASQDTMRGVANMRKRWPKNTLGVTA